jgi:cytochrome c peroxidase
MKETLDDSARPSRQGGPTTRRSWFMPVWLGGGLVLPAAMAVAAPAIELQATTGATRPLVMNRLGQIADQRGRALAVTRLDLLLSDFRLRRPDGTWVGATDWHGFFRAEQPGRREPLRGLPAGTYTAARFAVGVAPAANHADPNRLGPDDPLHPVVNNLHWGWTGGYIFVALEGHWQFDHAETGRTGGYSYHLAGDDNRVTVTLPGPLRLQDDSVLRLRLDASRLLAGVDIARDGESTHSRQQDAAVRALKMALSRAFTLTAASTARPAAPTAAASPRTGAGTATTTPYRWTAGAHLPSVALPADNPLTVEGVALGERLFHDPRLSRDGRVSCASCHHPDQAFADAGQAVSTGVGGQRGTRNAMPLFNLAWAPAYFWDGRAPSLRQQVLGPIQHPHEMAETLPRVVAKLSRDAEIVAQFRRALGGPVTAGRIGLALEQYLLTLVSQDAKFDRVMKGAAQFTPAEKRGFELFLTEHDPRLGLRGGDCFHCHGGALFTNHQFINIGLPLRGDDTGRAQVTGLAADRGKFRTPSLRNVALTAPYMHDGRFRTLEEVIEHYDHGTVRQPSLDPNLAKHPAEGLKLSAEDKAALVAFLKTLTDTRFAPGTTAR